MTFRPDIRTVGLDGILVQFSDVFSDSANWAAIAFRAHVAALDWPEILESSSTLVSAFFRIDLVEHDPAYWIAKLQDLADAQDWTDAPLPQDRSLWTLPAAFDGEAAPQLEEAAELAGMSPDAAVQDIVNTRLRVLTIGFTAGQPYLGPLKKPWNIPRQTQLTQRVPQGALVVAVQQVVLFAQASPTGWRQVGLTRFCPFQPKLEPVFALKPGDEVAWSQVSAKDLPLITDPWGGAIRTDLS
jgi:allophanate hydrolase subunit 1